MSRIYAVTDNATGKARLVRANSRSQAISHVARTAYAARVASQEDIVSGLTKGEQVEVAGAEEAGKE